MSELYWLADETACVGFAKNRGKPCVDDGRVLSGIILVHRAKLR